MVPSTRPLDVRLGLQMTFNQSVRSRFRSTGNRSPDDPQKESIGDSIRLVQRCATMNGLRSGEKTGDFNQRGRNLGGYSYTMGIATPERMRQHDPIDVVRFPGLRTRSHGIFSQHVRVTRYRPPSRTALFRAMRELITPSHGPARCVVTRYTALTGRMPCPAGPFDSSVPGKLFPVVEGRFIAENSWRRIPASIWLTFPIRTVQTFTWDADRFRIRPDRALRRLDAPSIIDPIRDSAGGRRTTRARGQSLVRIRTAAYEPGLAPRQKRTRPSVFPVSQTRRRECEEDCSSVLRPAFAGS